MPGEWTEKDSALSRAAGNELTPKYHLGTTDDEEAR